MRSIVSIAASCASHDRLRVVLPKFFTRSDSSVSVTHAEMRGGVRGVAAEAALFVDQRDAAARLLQQVCGRDARDPGADDQNVDGDVVF